MSVSINGAHVSQSMSVSINDTLMSVSASQSVTHQSMSTHVSQFIDTLTDFNTASLDFTASFSTLTFPAGSRPLLDTQPFNVPVMSDDLPENTESIVVLAEIDGGASVGTFTPGGNTAEINIIDDDSKDCREFIITFARVL